MPNLGDLGPGDGRDFAIDGVEVGQVLVLSYLQNPDDDEPVLQVTPRTDVLFKKISHERETMENGMIRHTLSFEVVRIGV